MHGPIRVLELRSVRGTGGGPEKTILLGAARAKSNPQHVTVCYIRDLRDNVFGIDAWAARAGVDYVEIRERHSLDWSIWPSLRRLVRDRRIDIVHAHEYKTDLLALLLARAESVIPLSTVHGWSGHSWRERHLYYPADKRLLARFPRLVAVSEEIRQELVRRGASPDRVTTIHNGIDHEAWRRDPSCALEARAALGVPAHARAVAFVGRLEQEKRVDILLQAFAHVARRRPATWLVIVGEGSQRGRLEDLARELGIAAWCRFVGHRPDVARLHAAFDLCVQSSDHEGAPNAVLEAMALETPIVATGVGGTPELIANGVHGTLVPAGDPAALAAAIEWALLHPETTARWAQAARARVEGELSFDARLERLAAVYEELVRTHGRWGSRRFRGRGLAPAAFSAS